MNLKKLLGGLGILAAVAAAITAVVALDPGAKLNPMGALALGAASLAQIRSSEVA